MRPQENNSRAVIDLDGMWKFRLGDGCKDEDNWVNGLPEQYELLYVPASYNDQREAPEFRTHCGKAYYEREIELPVLYSGQRLILHFGSVTHDAAVWFDGEPVAVHRGGFLPFETDITERMTFGRKHRLTVSCNNHIGNDTLPVGNESGTAFFGSDNAQVPAVIETKAWRGKLNLPNFDFFNYAGIHRHVCIYTTPAEFIEDITVAPDIDGEDGIFDYQVRVHGDTEKVNVRILDRNGLCVAEEDADVSCGRQKRASGSIRIKKAHFWEPYPEDPYLYSFEVSYNKDTYTKKVGIRTVGVRGNRFLINGRPFYFKGFGKHEDSAVHGKGIDEALNVKDASLLHWIGANSVRTSHYPYAEEFYDLCDEEGIVVIDETPAVGITAGGMCDPYAEFPLKKYHEQVLKELIARDKNHPCVVMWSLGNEPDTENYPQSAYEYWHNLYDTAHSADPQSRPVTFTCVQNDYTKDIVTRTMDVVCINRYYGWYNLSGDLDSACHAWNIELDFWEKLGKPVMCTEYGADAIPGLHGTAGEMFTEEFQAEYFRRIDAEFDKREFMTGEHPWCFADFGTLQGVMRPDGNRKGVFTRDRRPKMAAHFLKKRWADIPNFRN